MGLNRWVIWGDVVFLLVTRVPVTHREGWDLLLVDLEAGYGPCLFGRGTFAWGQ